MPIKGKVFIVPNAEAKTYEMLVINEGDREIGVTHNILHKGNENSAVHDDHGRYGHGMPVRPNDGSYMSFRYGDSYNNSVPIKEGSVLRVGLRYAAVTTVELPPLDGDMIELDFKDFHWYGNEAQHNTAAMRDYAAQAQNKLNLDAGKDGVRARIEQLLAQKRKGPPCAGEASITAVPGKNGALSHWEVRFENQGDTPWIGTCVFEGAQKNSGIGLESMACPEKGSAAVQRIEANGNYGVLAQAGAPLRIGVRGWGHANLQLPSAGTVNVSLKKFKIESGQIAEDFFDKGKVEEKRREKMNKVRFFDGAGKALNDELKPVVYRGEEAKQKTDFLPPRVSVKKVEDSEEHPGGGWVVSLENRLPAKDPHVDGNPDIGFVATLRISDAGGDVGWDPRQLPPKKFHAPGETKEWFIPEGVNVNGAEAKAGEELIVGTRGLGWFCSLKLPSKSKSVDTDKSFDSWAFREDQFARQNLLRDFTDKCRK
jgi:hypothetical protein